MSKQIFEKGVHVEADDETASNISLGVNFGTIYIKISAASHCSDALPVPEQSLCPVAVEGRRIGSSGGGFAVGSTEVFVPPASVLEETYFSLELYLQQHAMPPINTSQGESIVSPSVFLSPHAVSFKHPLLLDLPVCVPRSGWTFTLMRSESSNEAQPENWHSVVEYDPDTGIVSPTGSLQIRNERMYISISHSCWSCWKGRLKSLFTGTRKLQFLAFLSPVAPGAWEVTVRCFNYCRDILNKVKKDYGSDSDAVVKKVVGPGTLVVGREGCLSLEVVSDETEWSQKHVGNLLGGCHSCPQNATIDVSNYWESFGFFDFPLTAVMEQRNEAAKMFHCMLRVVYRPVDGQPKASGNVTAVCSIIRDLPGSAEPFEEDHFPGKTTMLLL